MKRSFNDVTFLKLKLFVFRRLKKNLSQKSEPFTFISLALDSITVTRPNYIRCLFQIYEKGFSVSVSSDPSSKHFFVLLLKLIQKLSEVVCSADVRSDFNT